MTEIDHAIEKTRFWKDYDHHIIDLGLASAALETSLCITSDFLE